MNKSNIIEKSVTLSRYEIKQYFEILNNYINGEGIDAELSYIAIKTVKLLDPIYKKIAEGIYNPDKDIKFQEYKQKLERLSIKYADRDEQGEVLLDNNKRPVITEQIVEFQNELNSLSNENKELIDLVNGSNQNNFNFLNRTETVKIYSWKSIDFVPDKIPAVIMYFMFNEEF